jgi:anti-sigma factor RsiW
MHGPIRDRLEELLNGRDGRQDLNAHLASCAECSGEVSIMKQQSEFFRSLRAPEEMDPAPGFYARVMQRIEERGVTSIWSAFAYSTFGKRLAVASLALALALGTWVIGSEREDGHLGFGPVVAQESNPEPVAGDQQHQRDVVLVNLVSSSDSGK